MTKRLEAASPQLLLLLLAVLNNFPLISVQTLADNRCYLENGASSENFFVSEDLKVDAIVGRIKIHGNAAINDGNILLRLKEAPDSPVDINPGTKDIVLKRKLDKEGLEGPSSVFVNLICERLHTLDPGFVIPINIRVTDANDNAPIFVNAPYLLNISEVTVVGTRVLQGVHAIDNDQQGPFSSVRYSVLPGPNSDYFEFENELEGTLVLKKPLDYEILKRFDVHIRAQDLGEPPKASDTVLTVYVVDADDQNPRFLDESYQATIPNNPKKDTILIVKPRDIKAYDQDQGINAAVFYTFNGATKYFTIDKLTAKVTLVIDLNEHDLMQPTTLVIKATQQDNPDRYALATFTISRNTNAGIQFLHRTFYIKASEGLPPGAMVATLSNNRPGQHLKYFVSDQNILKTFALNTKGELSLRRKLDFEEKSEYVFKVFATDGKTNDSSIVNVTLEDINEWEPRFRYPNYEFFVRGRPDETIGRIEAADGDKGDQLTLTLNGGNATMFFITPNGELRLRESRTGDLKGTAKFSVTASDSGHPPKRATVPVTVHFPETIDYNQAVSNNIRSETNGQILLAGLGAILLLLTCVVAFLVAYICKVKRKPNQELPTLRAMEKHNNSGSIKNMNNPMFATERVRTPMAIAMGGAPSNMEIMAKSRLPSPKVHPAPQPPQQMNLWPPEAGGDRVKKLSWGDKTDSSDSVENTGMGPKISENTNLTVYF